MKPNHLALLLAILLTPALSAQEPPSAEEDTAASPIDVLRFEWGTSKIRNHAGQSSNRDERAVSISARIFAPDTLEIEVSGTRVDKVFYSQPSMRQIIETTTWSTRWTGIWVERDEQLVWDLTREDYTCERATSTDQGPAQIEACEESPPSTHLRLVCVAETVELQEVGVERTWRCTPDGPTHELGPGPDAWRFGHDRCVDTHVSLSGRKRVYHRPCPAP